MNILRYHFASNKQPELQRIKPNNRAAYSLCGRGRDNLPSLEYQPILKVQKALAGVSHPEMDPIKIDLYYANGLLRTARGMGSQGEKFPSAYEKPSPYQ
jgi:hypothetical protein